MMLKYVGIKTVEARPATYGEYLNEHPEHTPKEIKIPLEAEGFIVRYKDGYTSWSPKAPFIEAYTPLLANRDVDSLTLENLFKEIESCNFECEGGGLKNLVQYMTLKKLLGVE